MTWWMPWSHPDAKTVPEREGVSPFLNGLAPMALEFGPRSVVWDDLWTRVYGVLRYPPQVGTAWLARIANHEGVYLSLQAEPTDPTQLALALTRAITQMTGQLQGGSLNPLVRQRLMQQVADAETLLKKIDAEQQSLFLTGVFVLVTAPESPDDSVANASKDWRQPKASAFALWSIVSRRGCCPWGLGVSGIQI